MIPLVSIGKSQQSMPISQREFDEKVTPILGHSINFVQDNESMSTYGVMRGLHIPRASWCAVSKAQCSM